MMISEAEEKRKGKGGVEPHALQGASRSGPYRRCGKGWEKVLRYEADEGFLGFQPASQDTCKKTRIPISALRRYPRITFREGSL
jgi:hypothetical protein